MRARYAHRITPDDLGSRVSVRRWTDDPDRGPVPTDVVGRLVAWDRNELTVVTRDGVAQGITLGDILSSRTVPEHPRLPAEPAGETRDTAIIRPTARLLIIDDAKRILLFRITADGAPLYWGTPGGGLRAGESYEEAASREAREEVGHELTVGPCVWHGRYLTGAAGGRWWDKREHWFLLRCTALEPTAAALEAVRDEGVDLATWMSADEVATATPPTRPRDLGARLADLLRDGPPDTPIALDDAVDDFG